MALTIILIVIVVFLIVFFAGLPGKIAEKRNHSKADMIKVAGYVGILFFGVFWVAALIWAYSEDNSSVSGVPRPKENKQVKQFKDDQIKEQIAELSMQIERIEDNAPDLVKINDLIKRVEVLDRNQKKIVAAVNKILAKK